MQYPIPPRTNQAFNTFKTKRLRPQNAGLLFERYTPMIEKESGDEKREALDKIVEAAKQSDTALLADWVKRWRALTIVAHAEPFTAKTDWRFVTGLGRKGVLEVGFTFHRYGFPILPGSSVKGVARAYARLALEMQDPDDKDAPPDFTAVFGRAPQKGEAEDVAQAGGAIFFDALPEKNPVLVVDILNPHYPDYYNNKGAQAPTNWQSPKPVNFLTVEEGTPFCFAVGWRGEWNDEAKRLQALAVDWLKGGLSELGAGAKTSAGYGYFTSSFASTTTSNLGKTATGTSSGTTDSKPDVSPPPSGSPKGLNWKKGKVSKNQRRVKATDAPESVEGLPFHKEHLVGPHNWMPAGKSEVEFAVEELPDGAERVWVKKSYYPVE